MSTTPVLPIHGDGRMRAAAVAGRGEGAGAATLRGAVDGAGQGQRARPAERPRRAARGPRRPALRQTLLGSSQRLWGKRDAAPPPLARACSDSVIFVRAARHRNSASGTQLASTPIRAELVDRTGSWASAASRNSSVLSRSSSASRRTRSRACPRACRARAPRGSCTSCRASTSRSRPASSDRKG